MRRDKNHYGWIVTLGCGIILFYSLGLGMNCFAVFIGPMIDTFGLTRTQGSSVASVLIIGGLLSMPAAGVLIRRFGARRTAFSAGICMAFAFLLFSISRDLAGCYIAAALFGIGYGAGSLIPVSVLMTNWFDSKRGFALGIATVGSGISTIIYPPLIALIIENYGLAAGFRFNFLNMLILSTVAFLLIRDDPRDVLLKPYGFIEPGAGDTGREPYSSSMKQAFQLRKYHMIMLAIFLLGLTITSTVTHISVVLTAGGHGSVFAAAMVSVFGFSMIVSKPLYGMLIDRFGVLKSTMVAYALLTFSYVSALLIGKADFASYTFVIFIGLGIPVASIGFPIWASALFGEKHISSIFPTFQIAFTVGGLIGSILPGLAADLTGSYQTVFWFFMIFLGMSFITARLAFRDRS